MSAAATTLSSRAEQDRPKGDSAESRDLLSVVTGTRPDSGTSAAEADSRSFDSEKRFASESLSSAQDDKSRSSITNDPNRAEDPEYIARLIGQVVTVSLETVKIVRALPPMGLPG